MMSDSEQLRVCYEGLVKQNPSNVEAVHYLAVWHLERSSFQQSRKYFGHLATLQQSEPNVWLCLCVCCAMADEVDESNVALSRAIAVADKHASDIRIKFCTALLAEKKKDYAVALEEYTACLGECREDGENAGSTPPPASSDKTITFMKDLKGEIMLRIAVLRKEMGLVDLSMQMCNSITAEPYNDAIRANALCLKGLLHEIRAEFPASEVVYRSALNILGGHNVALERLGRVYLRYRETIPAAVQCFFKSVETNPSNHIAWYLLGRCYMATAQYSDACEAYNRAVNLNPNDPQVWCSLGVLYYAFGQYREALGMLARALKLDPTMADAWYNVGALYDMCDQPEDAQQAYMKARENGLADRFARAGVGLNPIAMQSMQYMQSGGNSHQATSSSSHSKMHHQQHQHQQHPPYQHQQQANNMMQQTQTQQLMHQQAQQAAAQQAMMQRQALIQQQHQPQHQSQQQHHQQQSQQQQFSEHHGDSSQCDPNQYQRHGDESTDLMHQGGGEEMFR